MDDKRVQTPIKPPYVEDRGLQQFLQVVSDDIAKLKSNIVVLNEKQQALNSFQSNLTKLQATVDELKTKIN